MERKIPIRLLTTIAIGIGATGDPAAAHAPFAGIGSFYGGLIHPFLALPELLLLLSVSLLLGRAGNRVAGSGFLILIAAIVAGMMLPLVFPSCSAPTVATLGLALACAATLSLDVRSPAWILSGTSGASGIFVGVGVTPDEGPFSAMMLAGVGSALGAAFVSLILAGVTLTWHRGWKVVLIRLLGAWVSAIGIMTVALHLRR